MKSKLAAVKLNTLYPKFLAMVNAFKKTSGKITFEPILAITPPFPSFETTSQKILKSFRLSLPIAAPLTLGCWFVISVPIAA